MSEPWSPHRMETLSLSPWTVHAVADAYFRADGGLAFSMVPRLLWEKEAAPASDGRVPLRIGALLIEGAGARIVVDTGVGERGVSRNIRGFFGELSEGGGLFRALDELGWKPDSVTHVILTHLHVDHAGGLTDAAGRIRFPEARIVMTRRELAYAADPHPLRKPVFDHRLAAILPGVERLDAVGAMATEILPGVDVFTLGGHTPGLLGVRVRGTESTLFLPGDLIPTRAHLRPRWVLSYDQDPALVYEQRRRFVARAMALNWIVHFCHDPRVWFGRVKPGGEVEAVEVAGRGEARAGA